MPTISDEQLKHLKNAIHYLDATRGRGLIGMYADTYGYVLNEAQQILNSIAAEPDMNDYKAALEALDYYIQLASTGHICVNPPLRDSHCQTIRAAIQAAEKDKAEPQEVTIEEFSFRFLPKNAKQAGMSENGYALAIGEYHAKWLMEDFPNGLKIVKDISE